MDELAAALDGIFKSDTYKYVLSSAISGGQYRKIVINKKSFGYQAEKLTDTQAFHENMDFEQARELVELSLGKAFSQFNAWDGNREYALKVTKKGKLLKSSRSVSNSPDRNDNHDREKEYILSQGKIIPPLIDMGIFTNDGRIAKSMYPKYRQINRFIEIIGDEVENYHTDGPLHVIDFGCGKSYLTFILYYYLTEIRGFDVRMTGLDLKSDVIEKCNKTAKKYGYNNLTFKLGDIKGYSPEHSVQMVVTLHACDTATDYALYNAINWGADLIFSVPCCQHELSSQMRSERLSLLTRYGIIKERTASLITDGIRANLLEYSGYRTQILEFVDFDHTPKNLLIRAVKTGRRRESALSEVEDTIREFDLLPMIYNLIINK